MDWAVKSKSKQGDHTLVHPSSSQSFVQACLQIHLWWHIYCSAKRTWKGICWSPDGWLISRASQERDTGGLPVLFPDPNWVGKQWTTEQVDLSLPCGWWVKSNVSSTLATGILCAKKRCLDLQFLPSQPTLSRPSQHTRPKLLQTRNVAAKLTLKCDYFCFSTHTMEAITLPELCEHTGVNTEHPKLQGQDIFLKRFASCYDN